MKLSSRAVYGIRVCSLIAAGDGLPLSVSNLASQTKLSEKYLEQILGKLVKRGVLLSARGANGGYVLAKSAESVTLYDVLYAVDDAFVIGCDGDCKRGDCPDRTVFEGIANDINEIFRSETLAGVVRSREEQ